MSSYIGLLADNGAGNAVGTILFLGVLVLIIAGVWKTFTKAGEPGWAALIPIYNVVVLCRIAGKPEW
ncbi:MAG TPA: DUF5684 domain-containing protein, partial [Planctomycetaceae bacterium]|nr:DUF5684 domain-containing protein [Planctomycetaceae bacterium]